MPAPTIVIYHDTRRKKDNGLYPVKLRVYFNYETRYYPIGKDLSKDEFIRSYLAQKPRDEFKKLKQQMSSIEVKANKVMDELKDGFSFDKFEKKMFRPIGSENDVFYYYERTIKDFQKRERVNTASNYELSQKSIKNFLKSKGKNPEKLQFDEVTVTFLKDYEGWMRQSGKSITTVGIYLRPLAAVFNHAIADTETLKEIYPFSKRKYQIPAGRNIKKSLNREELARLRYHVLSQSSPIEKARDFWFFSFVCNGMNMRDICELKYSDFRNDTFSFFRTKTKYTTKGDLKPIIVHLNEFSKSVIEKYGNKRLKPDTYVFPVFKGKMNETEKVRAVENFTRFVNQHMKTLAKAVGVTEEISTYWARHSFTTSSVVNNGMSLEFIQGCLGHKSISTTHKYWGGFEESVIKDNSEQLMNF
jgi:site-specific recombinase XerD